MTTTLYSAGTVVASTWLNDVDKATYNTLSSVAGTNTITAVGPVSATSYTTGLRYFFNPQNTNTGAVTLNVSGLGAKAVTKYGSTALVAGDLVAGAEAYVYYDGTQFQLLNPQVVDVAHGGTGATTGTQALINLGATGRLLNVQTFTASGTYTPTAGATRAIVELVGGGGAGGGAGATGAGQQSAGGVGGTGAYTKALVTSLTSVTVTVGAGGTGVSGGTGNNGTASSFGAGITAPGGGGSISVAATVGAITIGGGAAGAAGVGGNIFNRPGVGVIIYSITPVAAGQSPYGQPGPPGPLSGAASGNGANADGVAAPANSGGGGGGSGNGASQAARTGGAGGSGIVIVYEYS